MIDWTVSRQLEIDVGAAFFADLLTIFKEETDIRLQQMDPTSAQIEHDLHVLKDAALNFGFSGLAGLCQAAAFKAKSDEVGHMDLSKIKSGFDENYVQLLAERALRLAS